jgi:hypothetical protein
MSSHLNLFIVLFSFDILFLSYWYENENATRTCTKNDMAVLHNITHYSVVLSAITDSFYIVTHLVSKELLFQKYEVKNISSMIITAS